jgi:hypothetical protein
MTWLLHLHSTQPSAVCHVERNAINHDIGLQTCARYPQISEKDTDMAILSLQKESPYALQVNKLFWNRSFAAIKSQSKVLGVYSVKVVLRLIKLQKLHLELQI